MLFKWSVQVEFPEKALFVIVLFLILHGEQQYEYLDNVICQHSNCHTGFI